MEILIARALEQPDRVVYTKLDHGETEGARLTFGELDRRARAVAATLRAAGAAGERVVVMIADELTFIEAFFGVLYAGAIAVPAYPPLRPKHAARTQGIFSDAGARFVIAPARTLALFDAATDGFSLTGVQAIACEEMAGTPDETPPVSSMSDAPCFLQYTSGSTGVPKGVIVTHGNVIANLEMVTTDLGLGAGDTVVSWNPLFHDMGLMAGMLFPLYSGSRAYLMSPPAFIQRPERLLRAVDRYRAAIVAGPNFAFQYMIDAIAGDVRAELDLSSLRVALNGAEPVRASTLRAFDEAFGPCGLAPGALMPAYGLAEATVYVSGGPSGRPWRSQAGGDLVGHGAGAPRQVLRVVAPATGAVCPPGEEGEIWVAGAHVTPGYWNRPELEHIAFGILEEEGGPTRFFRTGDTGFLDGDGELFVTGRIKDLIILRGRNYSPADLERVAEAALAPIRSSGSAAFTVERGDDDVVVLAIEAFPDPATDLEALRTGVARAVSREVGVQVADVVLVPTRLPRTTSGKVQRHRARASYLEGAWVSEREAAR